MSGTFRGGGAIGNEYEQKAFITMFKFISTVLIIILATNVLSLIYYWTQGNNDLASIIKIITYIVLAVFVFLTLKKE